MYKKILESRTAQVLRNSAALTKIVWQDKARVLMSFFVISIGNAVLPSAVAWSTGAVINRLVSISAGGSESVIPELSLLIGFGVLTPLLYLWRDYIGLVFYFYLEQMLSIRVLNHRVLLDVATYENPQNQNLLNTLKENGLYKAQNFLDRQYFILENLITIVLMIGILAYLNWWIILIVFLATLPELVVEMVYGNNVWGMHGARAEIRRKFYDIQNHIQEKNRLIELKLFQNTTHFIQMVRDLFHAFMSEQQRHEVKKFYWSILSLFLSQGALALAITWFVFSVARGEMSIGTFTFVMASIVSFRHGIAGLFRNLGRQYNDSLFVTDLLRFLSIKPSIEVPRKENAVTLTRSKTPEIIFENVTFTYPGTTTPVLKNFSLTIPPGAKVAFVGVNGAGKTTFVKLLCRFYDPTEGRILIDGIDLKTIDLESWYAVLGVLFQDYANYNFLVKESIALGDMSKEFQIDAIKKAAQSAEADVFIEEWEKNYEQTLGNTYTGGVEPSIGQWQKLALARTFYRDPRILILDEPTSAIDAEAEAKIFEKLEALPEDHTVFLISHRFSTVRNATQICVIKDGMLHENGTHEELIVKNGTYAKLFALQAKGYQ